tara:strand:+ start:232 stop:378 length:147 start_codon:yes stop_codon:yes gene_type:complete
MTKQETKNEITKIAKRLNTTFLDIATTILEQGTKEENIKNINDLIKEL